MTKNINHLLKQAQQMQVKMQSLQQELEHREIETSSGGGMIKVRINGKQQIIDVKLNPECVTPNDVEMLQEIVKTGINQAIKESQEMVSSAMGKITGGINIPGLF